MPPMEMVSRREATIFRPFSSRLGFVAGGTPCIFATDLALMESMESGPCGARAYEFCKIQFFAYLRNLRLYIAAPAGLWLKS